MKRSTALSGAKSDLTVPRTFILNTYLASKADFAALLRRQHRQLTSRITHPILLCTDRRRIRYPIVHVAYLLPHESYNHPSIPAIQNNRLSTPLTRPIHRPNSTHTRLLLHPLSRPIKPLPINLALPKQLHSLHR